MQRHWVFLLAAALLGGCDDGDGPADGRGGDAAADAAVRVLDARPVDATPDVAFVVDCDDGDLRTCGTDLGECRPGRQLCAQGLWGPCEDAVSPRAERCNGLDEDCDGRADEGYAIGGRCKFTTDRGLEVDGVFACDSEGDAECRALPDCNADADGDGVNVCQDCDDTNRENYPGNAERCDGRDNDCDGMIDEPFALGRICYAGEGICRRGGASQCDALGGDTGCDAVPGAPDPLGERCGDDEDNDCDGQTDEGFDLGQRCVAGVGACQRAGVFACAEDGRGVRCSVEAGEPAAERCGDGVDDDCDGRVDEGFEVGADCVIGEGACARRGRLVCGADGAAVICDAMGAQPAVETCGDGRDDDCDGRVDEGFEVGAACSVGAGRCARSGVVVCAAGGADVECSATSGDPVDEICGNGGDDDCDGVVDEGFAVGGACAVGVGACQRSGRTVCTAAGDATTCSAQAGAPGVERCNTLDDDCDGQTDEGYALGQACAAGEGECRNTGGLVCALDGGSAVCDALPLPPVAELCDTRDNDCDGATDEAFPQLGEACDSPDPDQCARGYWGCDLRTGDVACFDDLPSPEVCNYLDDDCDGEVDNGIDIFSDPENCGACGEVCPAPNGSCRAGVCYRNYWVSAEGGSDAEGDGSRQLPWRTLTHAASQVRGPRATIHVLAGTYSATMHPEEFERFPVPWPDAVEIVGEGNPLEVIVDVDHRGAAFSLANDRDAANRLERMRILRGGQPRSNVPALQIVRSQLTLVDVTFEDAEALNAGAVMENLESDVTVEHCTFLRNRSTASLGVLRHGVSGRLVVSRSLFRLNDAGIPGDASGVVQAIDTEIEVSNSAFVENTGNGVLVSFRDGDATVVNNTFAGNGGAGLYVRDVSHAVAYNNVFAFNGRYGIVQLGADPGTVDAVVANLFFDNGLGAFLRGAVNLADAAAVDAAADAFRDNVEGDPRFISLPSGNTRPLPGSAVVDRADPAFAPAVDQDGRPRPQGPLPDIGAFEAAP